MPLYVPQKMQLLLLRRQKKNCKTEFSKAFKNRGKKGRESTMKILWSLNAFCVNVCVCCLEVFFLNGAWKNVVFRKWEKKLFWWRKEQKWFITKNLTIVWWWHHITQCEKRGNSLALLFELFRKVNSSDSAKVDFTKFLLKKV